MTHPTILLPVMVLAGWTLCVLLLVPYQRFKAAFAGKVTAHDFKFGESARVPQDVSIPNRNLMNLLEVPVLFYVVCVVAYFMQKADPLTLTLAWSYVVLRMLHSLVHLSYNQVMHRMAVFAASNGVLALLWLRLFIALLT